MATHTRTVAAALTMTLGLGGLLAAPAYAGGAPGNGFMCSAAGACEQEYDLTGSPQTFVVPQGVTSLDVELGGGAGGSSPFSAGGAGGDLEATVPVTAGHTLHLLVGGAGAAGLSNGETSTLGSAAGGFGGGGNAGQGSAQISFGGGGGGGGSFLFDADSATLLAVAGGGGGGGGGGLASAGGNGGASGTDQAGTAGVTTTANSSPAGGGPGTATGAGTGGAPATAGYHGSDGTGPASFTELGVGGAGANNPFTTRETSGGGGGGYYGGGGGASNNLGSYTSGGGGGSGYLEPSATAVATDTNGGDGYIEIGYHKAKTRTVLHAPHSVQPGQAVTLTASVTAGGTPVRGATVTFTSSSGKTLGTAIVQNGVATLKVTVPSDTTVKATTGGDDGYLASTSSSAKIAVVAKQHSTSKWYVDPLSKAQRSRLAPVPAHPDQVHGKQRFTKAIYRTHHGRLAVPAGKVRSHQLHHGQAVQVSALFRFNQGSLDRHARRMLARLARSMKSVHAITCEGNADYAGLRNHELKLSWERARAVCSTLRRDVGHHLGTKAIGYGPSRPAVIGGTPTSRVANRRVDVRVTR